MIKRIETDYNLAPDYVSKRILGLPLETRAWGKNDITQSLEQVSRMTYVYDGENFTFETNQIPTTIARHDTTNFGSAFVLGRGNLTSTTRHDVTGQTAAVTSKTRYDIAGSVVAQLDPLNRKVRVEYTDAFNDLTNRNSFAYPTKVYDPANNYSEVKYRFDIGANVWAKSPAPAGNSQGKITEREYDDKGRLIKDKVVNHGGAYTRYEYPTNGIQSKVFSTIIDVNNSQTGDTADEVLSESWTDGAGRVRRARTEHPGSIGGWSATIAEYDILGRMKKTSVPTEVSVPNANDPLSWTQAGDDQSRGWLYTHQKYDWKNRVVRKINTDGIDQATYNDSDVLISYEGCGCAGGEITTIQSELVPRDDQPTVNARRTKRTYADIIGRPWKTEVLNWDGVTVYSSATTSFNGLDQPVTIRQFKGVSVLNNEHQTTSMTYDGHGRLKTRRLPEQEVGSFTTYNYNSDDRIVSMVDARGATVHHTYNDPRGLLTRTHYTVPAGSDIRVPGAADFLYDSVGNRTQMTDELGSVYYAYDQLSRMSAEARVFAVLGTFTLNYTYGLSGQLNGLSDPTVPDLTVGYSYDRTGRLQTVSGTGFNGINTYASDFEYRAFGVVKRMRYGSNEVLTQNFNNRGQVSEYQVGTIANSGFNYYADGRLNFVDNHLAPVFDRLDRYDHIGRITESLTGAEARLEPPTTYRPYKLLSQYNAFDNPTSRTSYFWSETPDLDSALFVNNRRQQSNWTYDAANYRQTVTKRGNLTSTTRMDLAELRLGEKCLAKPKLY